MAISYFDFKISSKFKFREIYTESLPFHIDCEMSGFSLKTASNSHNSQHFKQLEIYTSPPIAAYK
jgi:hypothetical protein